LQARQEKASMGRVADQDLVAGLARSLVERIAPEEQPLFAGVSRAYFAHPEAVAPPNRTRPDPLAFGLEGSEWLLTPAILAVAAEVVRFLLDALKDAARPEIAALIRRCLHRCDPGPEAPEQASSLTPEQLERLREVVLVRADPLLPEPKAKLLADAIIGALATRPV
jgi:hypothetical protein